MPQQSIGAGEFEDGAAGCDGVQKVGHYVEGVVEAFAVLRSRRQGVRPTHLAGSG